MTKNSIGQGGHTSRSAGRCINTFAGIARSRPLRSEQASYHFLFIPFRLPPNTASHTFYIAPSDQRC